ncbi:hypothetical protein Tco_0770189 [Tanacetum coccineum]|uniref:Uncharacterized protein n=1 Tax=Tanacetum coccineum TaxID=301880 RepID=A0ABQ4ZBI6_9ASTR
MARAYSAGPSEKKENAYLCATSAGFTTMVRALNDCPEMKNRNHGNQNGGTEARGMVYALGGGETDQDPNNMEDNIDA